jgi:phage-related protein (TIGR01555 family)
MAKTKTAKNDSVRRNRKDSADTWGVRGAGATWQARFGMPLNEADLLFAARREPIANRVVFKVAHSIFAKGFKVEEISERPDPNWSREVAKVLDGLNAKASLTQLVEYERLFGWAILALTYVDYGKDASAPVSNPKEIRGIMPYGSLQCTVQSSDEDKDVNSARYGLPVRYTVRRSGLGQNKLHFSRVIHDATRLLDHPWKGMSALEVLYDDQTILRNARWGLGETLVRQAAGFADITFKGAKKKQVDDFAAEENLKQLNARSFFVHDDNVSITWVGAAGKALNPEPYVTPILESASCAADIPQAMLRGANAGALTGSEVNEREYWSGISVLQLLHEPTIWELIDRLMETGQIREVEDYRVVWPAGFELTEKDKAIIKLQLAQARSLETSWMTLDEIRAEESLKELPDGAGKVVLGLKKAESQPFGQSAASDEADMNRFVRFFSRLWRKKKSENGKSSSG